MIYDFHMPYISILLTLLLLTFLAHKISGVQIYRKKSQMIAVNLFLLIVGVIWDSYAIRNQHWIFPDEKVIGHIGIMPVEEYMFIFIITYFILVTYHVVMKKI